MKSKGRDGVQVLRWEENITIQNVEMFRQRVNELLQVPEELLVLHLVNMEYINSSGLGIIAESVLNARKKKKELVIAEISNSVQEIFKIVKFESFIKVFSSEQAAVDYLVGKHSYEK